MWHEEQGWDAPPGVQASPAAGRPAGDHPARAAASWRRTAATACLGTPFAALLAVPLYAQEEPRLAEMPFFYWYQLIWMPLGALLTATAWQLHSRGTAPGGQR